MTLRPLRRLLSIAAMACIATAATAGSPAVTSPRLYAMDCGRGDFADMGMFSDTGEYDGKAGRIVVPCYLIVHPKGNLIWDTGLGDQLAGKPEGQTLDGIVLHVDHSLKDQLAQLDLKSERIDYVSFSHFHFDHTGNASQFAKSVWLLNKAEEAAAFGPTPPFGVDPKRVSAAHRAKVKSFDGDYDVFGDGSVRILKAPGHTPGHQVLLLKLANSGAVLLSGDLYHTLDNAKQHRVPRMNTSRADTLASFDRIDRIIANEHARLVVQHAPEDFAALPAFPNYLD